MFCWFVGFHGTDRTEKRQESNQQNKVQIKSIFWKIDLLSFFWNYKVHPYIHTFSFFPFSVCIACIAWPQKCPKSADFLFSSVVSGYVHLSVVIFLCFLVAKLLIFIIRKFVLHVRRLFLVNFSVKPDNQNSNQKKVHHFSKLRV